MDISQVITEKEFNSIKSINYKDFCVYATRLTKLCIEEALKSLPAVVQHLSKQVNYLNVLSEAFYKQNKDLKPHRRLVVGLIEKYEAENPGASYERVLELASAEARRVIPDLTPKEGPGKKNLIEYDKKLDQI